MVKEIKAVMVKQKALVMRVFIVLNTLLLKQGQPTNGKLQLKLKETYLVLKENTH